MTYQSGNSNEDTRVIEPDEQDPFSPVAGQTVAEATAELRHLLSVASSLTAQLKSQRLGAAEREWLETRRDRLEAEAWEIACRLHGIDAQTGRDLSPSLARAS